MTSETIPCPLCRQSELFIDIKVPNRDKHIRHYGALYSGKIISEWKICGQCGFVHQNPRPTTKALNEFYLQSQYHAGIIMEGGREEYLRFARWYYSEKIDFALEHSRLERGRVFDIGCGQGGILKLFEDRGWESYGVEPDQQLAKFAIGELGLRGVKQGIFDSQFELEEKVDLIFTNHAFEHFADLDAVMIGVNKILSSGGYLFIAIPTYFKNRSNLSKQWMNSAHYSLFTHSSLNHLLSRYGFEEVAHTYSGWKKEIDDLWYLAKLTEKVSDPRIYFEDPKNISQYLRVVNPLRSVIFCPIYSHWATRVHIYTAIKLLMTSPLVFLRKASVRIKRVVKAA